ncbi:MAG: hypothetical protein JWP29_3555 [Rhodoferax sp.]|nr:hypothetical protein [Rhodoferax sp.]
MDQVSRYDVTAMRAVRTPEGYISDTPILTRVGVFDYRDPVTGKTRRELRLPEEVFHADSLASYLGKPITVGHPGMVHSKNAKQHVVGSLLSQGRQDGDNALGDVMIYDTTAVDDGLTELSLGYSVELEETPGEWNGLKYDAIQRKPRINHLAIVRKGRAGVSRLNLDAADVTLADFTPGDTVTMPDEKLADVRLDTGITYKAAPEVVHAVTKLQADLAAAVSRADAATATADSTKAALDTAKVNHEAELAKVRADAVGVVRARMDMEAKATALGVTVATGSTDHDLRVAVIRKVRGDALDLTGKSPDYVSAAYDLAVEDGVKRQDSAGSQRQQVNTGGTGRPGQRQDAGNSGKSGSMSAAEARAAYISRRLGQTKE